MVKNYTVSSEYDGATLLRFLRRGCGMSSSLVRATKFRERGFTRAGQQLYTDAILCAGDVITADFDDGECPCAPDDSLSLPLLYEDGDWFVFDKPAAMAVHPTLNHPGGTAANAFAALCVRRNQPLSFRPLFRLDRNTTGCLLVAKSRAAAATRVSGKYYLCVVRGSPPDSGFLDGAIDLEPGSIIKRCVSPAGKAALTEYRCVGRSKELALMAVRLHSGRTHQIRVHMADAGWPIVSDWLYGSESELIGRTALHCARVCFGAPPVTVSSPLPKDMRGLLERCGIDPQLPDIANIFA